MAQTANVARDSFQLPDGVDPNSVKRNKEGVIIEFRQPETDAYKNGVMMVRVKDKDGTYVLREKVYSISAGVSERFNDALDNALIDFNTAEATAQGLIDANGEPTDKFEAVSRAQYIRTIVASAVDYDLALEPEREPKGQGLAEHRARVNAKVTGFDTIMGMADNDPELKAKLIELGVLPRE